MAGHHAGALLATVSLQHSMHGARRTRCFRLCLCSWTLMATGST